MLDCKIIYILLNNSRFSQFCACAWQLSNSAQPITVVICALLNDALGQDIGRYWIMSGERW